MITQRKGATEEEKEALLSAGDLLVGGNKYLLKPNEKLLLTHVLK
jgi:hypothetical protein